MRISTLFYSIGQGIKNLFRNKGYTLASIATISSCLFLFGLFYAVITNISHMLYSAEENVAITVFFNEGVTEEQILQLKVALEERDEVGEIVYVSADEAWAQFSQELGEYADSIEENPLADSANLEVYLTDVSQQQELVDYLEGIDTVREVNRSDVAATTLTGANNLIAYTSVVIIAILFVVSIFLISNTVATGIFNHRDEITIMKYIGATDFFVRAPYVIEGLIIGLVGSLIPLGLTYLIYNKAIEFMTSRFEVLRNILTFMPAQEVFNTLIPVEIALGVGIGFIGSSLTIRKHLHV